MKILSVTGAYPELIQSMPVSRELRKQHIEILAYTGPYEDYRISHDFFTELGVPNPDYNLDITSGSNGSQTTALLAQIREVLLIEEPDMLIVYGESNSALASVLTASKMHIPVAHIDTGDRHKRHKTEDINREIIDRLANIHFCASREAIANLAIKGINDRVYWVGDVMLDAMQHTIQVARQNSCILDDLELNRRWYALITIQDPINIYNPQRLRQIIYALNMIRERMIFLVHPRTMKALEQFDIRLGNHIQAIKTVGYFDMLVLEENARLIATDSLSTQREAYFLGTPCLTLRDETECTETVNAGWNTLVGEDPEMFIENWFKLAPPKERPPIFGNGTAARQIVQILERGLPTPALEEMRLALQVS
jgi:UDP-GlcNAc3NAcA epimerase